MARLTPEEMNRLCNEVLSALEIREARLLNWGFINGSQTLDDLDTQLPQLLGSLSANSPELAALWERARAEGVSAGDILPISWSASCYFRWATDIAPVSPRLFERCFCSDRGFRRMIGVPVNGWSAISGYYLSDAAIRDVMCCRRNSSPNLTG